MMIMVMSTFRLNTCNNAALHPTWLSSLQLGSALTFIRNIVLQIAGILSLLLARVEDQAIRTQRPPGLASLTGPVLITLLRVREHESFVRQRGVGWTSKQDTRTN